MNMENREKPSHSFVSHSQLNQFSEESLREIKQELENKIDREKDNRTIKDWIGDPSICLPVC